MTKKIVRIAALAAAAATALALAGCQSADNSASGDSGKGQVYYLSFKPEQDEIWQKVAKAYT